MAKTFGFQPSNSCSNVANEAVELTASYIMDITSMALIFAFFNFLFFKIMSAAMFDDPMTIWASALTAIVVTMFVTFSVPLGAVYAFKEIEGREQLNPIRFIGVVIATCIASCVAGYLIVLGFSESLHRDVSRWRSYYDFWEQDLFWFCIMISIPVVVHLAIMFRQLRSEH